MVGVPLRIRAGAPRPFEPGPQHERSIPANAFCCPCKGLCVTCERLRPEARAAARARRRRRRRSLVTIGGKVPGLLPC